VIPTKIERKAATPREACRASALTLSLSRIAHGGAGCTAGFP